MMILIFFIIYQFILIFNRIILTVIWEPFGEIEHILNFRRYNKELKGRDYYCKTCLLMFYRLFSINFVEFSSFKKLNDCFEAMQFLIISKFYRIHVMHGMCLFPQKNEVHIFIIFKLFNFIVFVSIFSEIYT